MVQMWNEIWEQPVVLERCLEKNNRAIKEIVKDIHSHNVDSICIAARGTSDHAAVYGKYVLELETGIPVALAASSVVTMYNKSLSFKNSLVIGISQSGKAADVLEVIRNANQQGAVTVSITNAPDSPLAKEAKFHLYCEAGLEKSVAATKTFTTQIFLLAQLASEWTKNEDLKSELALVPQKLLHTFEVSRQIEDRVARFRFMNECFVLARGINYPVALESALKIQETTYVRAKAYATSDFHHGPFAMIDKDMPVIVFAPEGPSLKDVTEMLNKLKQSQAELIVISNVKDILAMGAVSFQIPDTNNDIISPFMNVVVAQMFACQLALVKGLNPDAPRGLNKVTVTR
ncbi:MAG: SIS domain-containing protein [Clostridia bacterium]|nr:SIS domain-containing protein [Clostridia bacterium]